MDSDQEIEVVEKDSGLSSLGGSKDETPERRTMTSANASTCANGDALNYDDEPDESIFERLWGLTEMFPEPLRNLAGKLSKMTVKNINSFYGFSCSASWIFFTSSIILCVPIIVETERAQMQEIQKCQQKKMLLGPGVPINASGIPALPPVLR